MKKIKLIIYHPYSRLGGADNSLKKLLEGLDTKKFSITFISLNNSIIKKDLRNKVKFINLNFSRAILSIFKLRRIVLNYKCSNKFSKIIIFSNQNYGNIISFISLFNLKNVKKIFIDRNHLDELNYSESFSKFLKNKLIKILIKLIYKHADLVIGISKKLSSDLSNFANTNVKTIYSPAFDKSIIRKATKKINLPKKYNYIINVSRFTKRKDHFTSIYGFKLASEKIKNLKLILIGYGPEYQNIKKLIQRLKIQKKVLIFQNINNPYPYIKKSSLLILSSKYEGMGNVLVEAITLNTPVISSNCKAGPSEILLHGKGGYLFEVSNFKDLSNKIIKYFKNKKILKKKLNIAKKELYRFELTRHIKIYTNVFERI